MQLPDAKNMQALKRLVRFLKGSPRCLVDYGRQAEQQVVHVFSDSDCAGCVKTRRSTSWAISLPRQPQLKMWWRQVRVTPNRQGGHATCAPPRPKGMDAEWAECDTFILRLCGWWPDVARVPRRENPADTGTKHLAQREMHECMRRADPALRRS